MLIKKYQSSGLIVLMWEWRWIPLEVKQNRN